MKLFLGPREAAMLKITFGGKNKKCIISSKSKTNLAWSASFCLTICTRIGRILVNPLFTMATGWKKHLKSLIFKLLALFSKVYWIIFFSASEPFVELVGSNTVTLEKVVASIICKMKLSATKLANKPAKTPKMAKCRPGGTKVWPNRWVKT